MTMSAEEMPLIKFFDTQHNGIYTVAGRVGISISANQPHNVVEARVALAHIASPIPAFLRTVCQDLFYPTFVGADITQVDRSQENLDSLFRGLADYPIRVFKVFFIGGREVSRNREGALPVPIDRATELMLDQIDDD